MCWKLYVFLTSIFHRFFSIFHDFGSILGGPGAHKINKKSNKSEKIDFLTRSALKKDSGRVLGRFWEGFGRVLGGFWEDFQRVLNGFWGDLGKIFQR